MIEDLREGGRAKGRRWAFGIGPGLGFASRQAHIVQAEGHVAPTACDRRREVDGPALQVLVRPERRGAGTLDGVCLQPLQEGWPVQLDERLGGHVGLSPFRGSAICALRGVALGGTQRNVRFARRRARWHPGAQSWDPREIRNQGTPEARDRRALRSYRDTRQGVP